MTEPNDIFKKAEEKVSNEQAQNIIANKDADWIMNTEAIMTELKEAAIQIIAERKPDVVPIIEQLKNKYKELFLYFFSEDEFYVYRPISRFEHKDLSQKYTNSEELAENIVLRAVLYPKLERDNLDNLKAGVIPTLLELILSVSNFGVNNPVIKL